MASKDCWKERQHETNIFALLLTAIKYRYNNNRQLLFRLITTWSEIVLSNLLLAPHDIWFVFLLIFALQQLAGGVELHSTHAALNMCPWISEIIVRTGA